MEEIESGDVVVLKSDEGIMGALEMTVGEIQDGRATCKCYWTVNYEVRTCIISLRALVKKS